MKLFFIRLLNMVIGILLYALGIIIAIKANVGYAPWEIFHVGLAQTTGLSLGIITIIVGFAILVLVTVFGEKLGLGTVASILLIGLFIDVILIIDFIPTADNMIIGIAMLLAGLYLIALATYFYIKSAFGAGPRDNLMVVMTRKIKLPVGVCRCIVEFAAALIGWLLGGMVGVGTAISVVAIGFFVQLTFRMFKFDVTAVRHESLKDTYMILKNVMPGCLVKSGKSD